jgi:RNA polymerase sigma factor (sigma-70 family)
MIDKIDADLIYDRLKKIKTSKKNKEVFILYYKDEMNMRLIGEKIGITKQRVEQIIRYVEKKLRKELSIDKKNR